MSAKLTKAHARKHLNKAEFELYTSTEKGRIEKLSEYRLKQKASRLKKLISKYSTQKRTLKRGLKARGFDASAESNRKIRLGLMRDMLKAVEKEMKVKKAEAKKVAKKSTKKTTKKAAKKTTKKVAKKASKKITKKATKKASKKKVAKKNKSLKATQAPKSLTKKKGLVKSGVMRKQGHASSRTKRSQGRRDN